MKKSLVTMLKTIRFIFCVFIFAVLLILVVTSVIYTIFQCIFFIRDMYMFFTGDLFMQIFVIVSAIVTVITFLLSCYMILVWVTL